MIPLIPPPLFLGLAAAVGIAALAAVGGYSKGRIDERAAVEAARLRAESEFRGQADRIAADAAKDRAAAAEDLARQIDALPKDNAHACIDSPALRGVLDRLRGGVADPPP